MAAGGCLWPLADGHHFPKADVRAAGFGKSRHSDSEASKGHELPLIVSASDGSVRPKPAVNLGGKLRAICALLCVDVTCSELERSNFYPSSDSIPNWPLRNASLTNDDARILVACKNIFIVYP